MSERDVALERIARWGRVVRVVYGGVPGGLPEGDAAKLDAIAAWMDSVDDAADSALDGRHSIERVGSMQQTLRRIAAALRAAP